MDEGEEGGADMKPYEIRVTRPQHFIVEVLAESVDDAFDKAQPLAEEADPDQWQADEDSMYDVDLA